MTPTIQPADSDFATPLQQGGEELVAAAQNVVYDEQSVQMIRDALQNTKRAEAIAPTVAMVAVSLLSQMGPKLSEVSDDEMWGRHGVVHVLLDAIFEVAKELGYKAPLSDLKVAYQIVEEQIDGQAAQQSGNAPAPMDQGMAESAMPVEQRPMMSGAMPQGAY